MSRRSSGWRALLLALLVLPAGGVGCGAPPPPASPTGVPGIVLLCVDTLRADLLGGPAAPRPDLPALEAFARGATTLRDMSANAAWTAPSVASLLTGLLPTHHGVQGDLVHCDLSPAPVTLAERVAAQGWYAAASTSGGWLTPEAGFAQGFHHFYTDFDRLGPGEPIRRWAAQRPPDRPFFLFLHTVAPHDPYGDKTSFFRGGCPESSRQDALGKVLREHLAASGTVPPELHEQFMRVMLGDPCGWQALGNALGPIFRHRMGVLKHEWMDGGYHRVPDGGRAIEAQVRAWYVGAMGYVNDVLAQTFAALDAAGLPEGTVVVVTSDHGEGLGETGVLLHGQSLQDPVLRVPCVIRAPGRLPAGATIGGGCGLDDLLPTLLELAGLPVPEGLDGRSFLPLVRGGGGPGRAVVAEAERFYEDPGAAVVRLLSVRRPEAKWVLHYDKGTGETLEERYFDLVADPEEAHPRPVKGPEDLPPDLAADVATARAALLARWRR